VPEEMGKYALFIKRKDHAMYGKVHRDVDMSAKPTKIRFD
jgi:hypothetical protein